jgi:hypothetical protein
METLGERAVERNAPERDPRQNPVSQKRGRATLGSGTP